VSAATAFPERPWLAPLGATFGAAAWLRGWLYRSGVVRQERLGGPVVSVGNLAVGGTGKTPVVARVAELLRDDGAAVAVLSRGYGGSFRGEALVVGDGVRVLADAREAGDEPVMLARALPRVVVAVGANRARVGRAVEARFGPRVFVLDDGFQHLRLARDLDLLCIDAERPGARPLPAGPLREFPSAARRADAVLLTQADRVDESALGRLTASFGAERTFRVRRRMLGFFHRDGGTAEAPARPFLVAAIAAPDRFEADVSRMTPAIAGRLFFRDHHVFDASDGQRVLSSAASAGADAIVTTDKDATRLPEIASGIPVLVFRIAAEIREEERFRERLRAVARRAA
jgi:tetraacyldisaccharide 4'-kinase